MTLSDTARRILTDAARHPLHLAAPPDRLPVAACRAVLSSLLKQGHVEECAVPDDLTGPRWQQQDGTRLTVRIIEAGMAAIGAVTVSANPANSATLTHTEADGTNAERGDKAQKASSAPLATPAAAPAPVTEATQAPSTVISTRLSLRDAARRVLAGWDDEAGVRADFADAMGALRTILVKPAPAARTSGPRKPREGTKQHQVLAMLRRPEGATVAQIAEATGWQAHTVRGFFAGLKRRQGIAIEAAERVRQIGPGKEGVKGSYTVYRIAEAQSEYGL